MKKHLYFVTGGLGKNVCFTSILPQLYKKHNSKICIEATWPFVFYDNPYVASVFQYHVDPIKNIGAQEHYREYQEIHGLEPYYSNFLKKEVHLITSYQMLNNLEVKETLPQVYWNLNFEQKLLDVINKISPFIIVQFSGGPQNLPYKSNSTRDYSNGQELINKIKQNYPNINILVFGQDNMNYENTLKMNFELTLQYFILSKFCLTFISIDSALQHFASNERLNKKGIVLWGETSPEHFGYKKNINLTSSTPHVVDIETNQVINQLKKII